MCLDCSEFVHCIWITCATIWSNNVCILGLLNVFTSICYNMYIDVLYTYSVIPAYTYIQSSGGVHIFSHLYNAFCQLPNVHIFSHPCMYTCAVICECVHIRPPNVHISNYLHICAHNSTHMYYSYWSHLNCSQTHSHHIHIHISLIIVSSHFDQFSNGKPMQLALLFGYRIRTFSDIFECTQNESPADVYIIQFGSQELDQIMCASLDC